MAYEPQRFVGPLILSQLATTPLKTFSNKAILKNIIVSNIYNGTLIYSIYVAPAGEDAQDYNKVFPDMTATEKSIISHNVTIVVNPGDRIFAKASIPGGILLTVSGVEVIS
jgi:hypothetical protein